MIESFCNCTDNVNKSCDEDTPQDECAFEIASSEAFAAIGGAAIIGILLGYLLRHCLTASSRKKSIVPVFATSLTEAKSMHVDDSDSRKFNSNGSDDDDDVRNVHTSELIPPNEMQQGQKSEDNLSSIVALMKPTNSLRGNLRMKSIIRNKLIFLQSMEKKNLMDSLEKLKVQSADKLQNLEAEEMSFLTNSQIDVLDQAIIFKLQAQDVA